MSHLDGDENHWHLDKRLNVGHLLTTMALAGSLFIWASAMERRVAVLETQVAIAKQQTSDDMHELKLEMRELRNEIKSLRQSLNNAKISDK